MGNSGDHWVHDLDPVIFQFTENIAVRWYGLAYVVGFLLAFGLFHLYWRRGRTSLSPAMQETFAMALIVGVVIGGRLGYFLLYDPGAFLSNPLIFFKTWEGGMASHGGFMGVALAAWWVARKYRFHPFALTDLIASAAGIGLCLGRLANFVNGELWGKVTDVPWAVIFPQSAPGYPVELIPARHPSQLYQALLEGLLLFVYMQWRFWSVKGRQSPEIRADNPSARPGHLTGEFLIGYSIARIVGELFREPDAALILGLSRGSFYSILFLAAGLGLVLWTRYGRLTNGKIR